MTFNWNDEKNNKLKKERGVSFEEIVLAISEDRIVDILLHPNEKKYSKQMLYLINYNNYIYVVPFVIDSKKNEIFLKTIFPSRSYTRKYWGEKGVNDEK
jgi:uncharacterized DUF497 family protein